MALFLTANLSFWFLKGKQFPQAYKIIINLMSHRGCQLAIQLMNTLYWLWLVSHSKLSNGKQRHKRFWSRFLPTHFLQLKLSYCVILYLNVVNKYWNSKSEAWWPANRGTYCSKKINRSSDEETNQAPTKNLP